MKRRGKNEKGFALLESVVFIVVFAVLTAFTIDFFTAIHTGIVHSIAARTYIFETLQHRADIASFRQEPVTEDNPTFQQEKFRFVRFHSVTDENTNEDKVIPAGRILTSVREDDRTTSAQTQGRETSTILIKSGYGICIDSRCSLTGGI